MDVARIDRGSAVSASPRHYYGVDNIGFGRSVGVRAVGHYLGSTAYRTRAVPGSIRIAQYFDPIQFMVRRRHENRALVRHRRGRQQKLVEVKADHRRIATWGSNPAPLEARYAAPSLTSD